MEIEINLRRFIRLINRIEGLEKFLNLNRNIKYRNQDIIWNITFEYINNKYEGETTYTTNALSSKKKRFKIQRLLEESPIIEQLKKTSYDIYKEFFCVYYRKKKETFAHIWTCKHNKKLLKTIDTFMDKQIA